MYFGQILDIRITFDEYFWSVGKIKVYFWETLNLRITSYEDYLFGYIF